LPLAVGGAERLAQPVVAVDVSDRAIGVGIGGQPVRSVIAVRDRPAARVGDGGDLAVERISEARRLPVAVGDRSDAIDRILRSGGDLPERIDNRGWQFGDGIAVE